MGFLQREIIKKIKMLALHKRTPVSTSLHFFPTHVDWTVFCEKARFVSIQYPRTFTNGSFFDRQRRKSLRREDIRLFLRHLLSRLGKYYNYCVFESTNNTSREPGHPTHSKMRRLKLFSSESQGHQAGPQCWVF